MSSAVLDISHFVTEFTLCPNFTSLSCLGICTYRSVRLDTGIRYRAMILSTLTKAFSCEERTVLSMWLDITADPYTVRPLSGIESLLLGP
jgi:hypothetical protein